MPQSRRPRWRRGAGFVSTRGESAEQGNAPREPDVYGPGGGTLYLTEKGE
jgi:hypothetical protein